MSRKKFRRLHERKNRLNAIIGIGLVLIGVALTFLLTQKGTDSTAQASASEYSVTPVEVNFPAPELALENLEGNTQALADFEGKVVLLNNWATWCPTCKAEMPSLKKFHDTDTVEGFTVIAVEAGDPREDVIAFATSLDLKFPVWLDPNGASLKAIGNDSLPNSYVIDRSGTVRLAWSGEISLAVLEKYVTPIIQESN